MRNTSRYLLSNLFDFDAARNAVAYAVLPLPDRWCLGQLAAVSDEVRGGYEAFRLTDAWVWRGGVRASYRALLRFTVNDLSATYFDIVKDRLYVRAAARPHA